jgi:hypothetical protein
LQAAQEREELQREGDSLDVTIKGAEQDVWQLEAALGQISGSNSSFKQSLRGSDGAAHEQEKAALRWVRCPAGLRQQLEVRMYVRCAAWSPPGAGILLACVDITHVLLAGLARAG